MTNFEYSTPTRLIFGKGVIEQLPEVMSHFGKRVLLTYGGGSIKRSGLYDKVIALLKDDKEIFELSGIEPNPKYETSVLDGVRMCKEHHIDVILAVGGGSVCDCSKAIAAGAMYDGETWDLIIHKAETKAALPIVDIMTMAATGSEYDSGGVITRRETNDKIGYMDPHLYPEYSLLDPTYTFTVPVRQTIAGVADAINHVLEQYFCSPSNMLSDGFCETALRILMTDVHKVLKNPEDYDARAEIFITCSMGCNGILALGKPMSGWPMHAIEHTLSAYYDITHGIGLAIITPRWMQQILSEKTVDRFVALGTRVLGIDASLPPMQIAQQAIDQMYQFFESIGIPMHLREVGIDDSRIDEMAEHTQQVSHLECAWAPLSVEDIATIMRNSL